MHQRFEEFFTVFKWMILRRNFNDAYNLASAELDRYTELRSNLKVIGDGTSGHASHVEQFYRYAKVASCFFDDDVFDDLLATNFIGHLNFGEQPFGADIRYMGVDEFVRLGPNYIFGRVLGDKIGEIVLDNSGLIKGYSNANEERWVIVDENLQFINSHGEPSTVFRGFFLYGDCAVGLGVNLDAPIIYVCFAN